MTPQSVESLMADIEAQDPVDVGELALDEQDARRLMANHFCEIDERLAASGLGPDERLEMMAAIAAHTMVENLVLHVERLRAVGAQGDFRGWMRRNRLG